MAPRGFFLRNTLIMSKAVRNTKSPSGIAKSDRPNRDTSSTDIVCGTEITGLGDTFAIALVQNVLGVQISSNKSKHRIQARENVSSSHAQYPIRGTAGADPFIASIT